MTFHEFHIHHIPKIWDHFGWSPTSSQSPIEIHWKSMATPLADKNWPSVSACWAKARASKPWSIGLACWIAIFQPVLVVDHTVGILAGQKYKWPVHTTWLKIHEHIQTYQTFSLKPVLHRSPFFQSAFKDLLPSDAWHSFSVTAVGGFQFDIAKPVVHIYTYIILYTSFV